MICSLLIASGLTLGMAEKPVYHSVQFFDNTARVSQRVLDRSMCDDIHRVHPLIGLDGEVYDPLKIERNRERNRLAMKRHCRERLFTEKLDASECNAIHE